MHRVSLIALAAVSLAAPVLAQTPPSGLAPGQVAMKTVIDRDVYSSDGAEIGEVEDLILDAEGRAVLAVIEVEGRLGLTSKYVAVPYEQLRPDNAQRRVNIAISRDQAVALPAFKYDD